MGRAEDQDFTAFVAERGAALLRIAYALTGDRHAAEDLVQSALAKAYARWDRIQGEAEPYVRRVLYNEQVSRWRWSGRRPEIVSATVPERPVTASDETTTLRVMLRDALRRLPPRQRAVLVLRYLEDLSVEQTAQVLGCRAGTVASQTSRALDRLRQLVPDFAGPAGAAGPAGPAGAAGAADRPGALR